MEIRAKCDFDEEMYKQLYRATMAKNEKPVKALRRLFKMRTEQNSVLFLSSLFTKQGMYAIMDAAIQMIFKGGTSCSIISLREMNSSPCRS